MKKKSTVWIVDDNISYCIVLSESLKLNKKIIAKDYFHSIKEVVKALQKAKQHPDVILLDIKMPVTSGIVGLPKILKCSPETKILMLTSHDDEQEIQESLKNGASGYLLKSSTAVDITRAIEKVVEGGSPLDPMITKKIIGMFMSGNFSSGEELHLTKRETEVIKFIIKGMSSEKIASVMGLSYYTITTHLKNIYKKLHVHSRHTLVAKAYKEGIIAK